MDDDGAAGGGQTRGRDGVGVEDPGVVGVVGAAVAALVGDGDADDVVSEGGDAEPGFSGGEAVYAGGCADGGCAGGVKGVPDADGGHGFGFGGHASGVEGLGDDGEGAVAADGEGEPVSLADLAEEAGPHAAGGQGARRGFEADGVAAAAEGGVGHVDGEGLGAAGGEIGDGDGREGTRGGGLAVEIGADGFSKDVEGVDGLEGDLVAGAGDAGRQGHIAEVEEALEAGVVGAPLGERVAVGAGEAGDGVAVVAVEVTAGDKGDGVLIEGIAVGVEWAGNDVDTLHAEAGAEGDGALDGDGMGGGELFAGEAGEVLRGNGVDAVEGGDVVEAEDVGVGDALAAGDSADAAEGLHDGPSGSAAGELIGKGGGVDLGVVEAEDAAEGALQLVAHHLEQIGGGGAEAVEKDDAVGDGGVGVEVVEPEADAVVLAAGGLAGAGAEEGVDDRAVGVVDDAEGIGGSGGGDVGGRGDGAVGDGDRGAVDIFIERALVGERDGGGGDGGPEGGSGVDHGGGLLVGDGSVERALVYVIVELAAGPVDGLAEVCGVEEADAGDVFGSAGVGGCGAESEEQEGGKDGSEAAEMRGEQGRHVRRSR